MHQQVRTGLGKASAVIDGSGAMSLVPVEVDPLELRAGALVELLTLLADNDFDLAMAAGDSIEGGGEFVFSIKDEERFGDCAALLRSRGYRNVRIVEPQFRLLEDHKGALRDFLAELVSDGRRIDEVFVGVTTPEGYVPVQVTTIKTV